MYVIWCDKCMCPSIYRYKSSVLLNKFIYSTLTFPLIDFVPALLLLLLFCLFEGPGWGKCGASTQYKSHSTDELSVETTAFVSLGRTQVYEC